MQDQITAPRNPLATRDDPGMLRGVSPISIAELKEQSTGKTLAAAVVVQLQSRQSRLTKNQKPYLELSFADATGHFTLKVWSDSPVFNDAGELAESSVLRLEGHWALGSFGFETKELRFVIPTEDEVTLFFAGDPALRAKQDRDFADIRQLCASIADPRLCALCGHFLATMGDRFRRTAAAKRNHHARRGGLVEHVAQMMRSAAALAPVYPELNRDLLLTGVLFHDCGKLWENCYPERGFNQLLGTHGEMLGHIPLGIELANKLWRETLALPEATAWENLSPPAEDCRIHLLHLIGSHHGEYEFGSPVLPKTPEAFALHYIDNLDAKLEMVRDAYAQSKELAPGIHDRVFPLPSNLVRPLTSFRPDENTAENSPADTPG